MSWTLRVGWLPWREACGPSHGVSTPFLLALLCFVGACRPSAEVQSWRLQRPAPGPPATAQLPEVVQRDFANGLTHWGFERATPTLSLELVCRAGSRYDPPGRFGTAAVLARMLLEGTRRMNGAELALRVERLGTELHARHDRETLSLAITGLAEDAEELLAVLSECALESTFPPDRLERVKAELQDQIRLERASSEQLAGLVAIQATLGAQLGHPASGLPAHVAALSQEQLQAFSSRHLRPDNCALLWAGPEPRWHHMPDHRIFTWRVTGPANDDDISAPHHQDVATRVYVIERASSQTSIAFALAIPPREVSGFEARQVIDSLFGGIFTSRINQNLRERLGYTYGATSNLAQTPRTPLWFLASEVRAETTPHALLELNRELDRLAFERDISSDEHRRGVAARQQRLLSRLQRTSDLVTMLRESFSARSVPSFGETLTRYARVTSHELHHWAAAMGRAPRSIVLVGPVDATRLARMTAAPRANRSVPPVLSIDASWLDGVPSAAALPSGQTR